MKKTIILLTLITLFGFSGCMPTESADQVSDQSQASEFSKVSELSSDKNISDNESIDEYSQISNWKIKYYVDDFGDNTDKKYLDYSGDGTFSNTATQNSNLSFSLLYDGDFSLILFEYGSSQVINSSNKDKTFLIEIKSDKVKPTNGEYFKIKGNMRSIFGDRIEISTPYDIKTISDIFSQSTEVKIHVVDLSRITTKYNFVVDTSNFEKKINEYNS